jgi:hypothetical protein
MIVSFLTCLPVISLAAAPTVDWATELSPSTTNKQITATTLAKVIFGRMNALELGGVSSWHA